MKWYIILALIIIIFVVGKKLYDIYSNSTSSTLGISKLSEPTLNANISVPTSNNFGIRDTGFRTPPQ